MTPYEQLDEQARTAADEQVQRHGGSVTNMKSTLLGHIPTFTAYMEWYSLKDELVPFIGERAVTLFSYAISEASDCLICSTFFRKALIDSGDDVDNPHVTDAERLLMDWGRMIARAPGDIPSEMYERLEATFQPKLRLILLAFAGLMVATNLINTVGKIPLDDELLPYRKPGDLRTD